MSHRNFLTADLHLGHIGICQFLNKDGTKLRPWDSYEEMDEAIIKGWNEKVRPVDKVYVLGDVVINRRALPTLSRLNGEKVLIKGNHDIFKMSDYLPYFKDVRGSHIIAGNILTHIPIHPASLSRWKMNIHGHLHSDQVQLEDGTVDKRYLCVSMEHTNFVPIELGELNDLIDKQHHWGI